MTLIEVTDAVDPLQGANDSTQYIGAVRYTSRLDGQSQTIQIEVSLRELLLRPATAGMARTLLLDPVAGRPAAMGGITGRFASVRTSYLN
jgi:hypothetical protein